MIKYEIRNETNDKNLQLVPQNNKTIYRKS